MFSVLGFRGWELMGWWISGFRAWGVVFQGLGVEG